jgi:hypothetical protein
MAHRATRTGSRAFRSTLGDEAGLIRLGLGRQAGLLAIILEAGILLIEIGTIYGLHPAVPGHVH